MVYLVVMAADANIVRGYGKRKQSASAVTTHFFRRSSIGDMARWRSTSRRYRTTGRRAPSAAAWLANRGA